MVKEGMALFTTKEPVLLVKSSAQLIELGEKHNDQLNIVVEKDEPECYKNAIVVGLQLSDEEFVEVKDIKIK